MPARFNEQVQHGLVSKIERCRCFEVVSLSGSVVEIVGDAIALSLCDGVALTL